MSMDNYTVKKVIGEGAYGRAVLCVEKASGEYCVIKEIAMANLSAQEQKDAKKEVKILSSLHHPNIIGYRTSFNAKNVLHIVMDYADNGDLFTQIQNARGVHFKEDQILDWFVQICLALKHIHDRKILHRDIKCQNIFLMKNGMIKMGDFGIAKILDHTTQLSKTAIGTPYYLSPEICEGKAYNSKSDIWSLGCVLYELCTLNHAFDANCMNGLIMKILRSKHAPIPYYYSQPLRSLVDSLLNKDAKKRPSINQILKLDFIRNRIGNLLSATMQKIEFSHTVFHKVKACETPDNLKPENFHKQEELAPISEDKPQVQPQQVAPSNNVINNKPHVKPTPKPYAPIKQAQPPAPEKPPIAKRPSPANAPAIAKRPSPAAPKKPKVSLVAAAAAEKPAKGGMKLTSHSNQSKEELIKKKNEMVMAEREKQKQLKAAREEEARKQEEIENQKRLEVQEKHKQAALERKRKLEELKREDAARKKKFDNLEAPFKAQMKAPPPQPSKPARARPALPSSSNSESPRSTGSNQSSDNEQKGSDRLTASPRSDEDEKPMKVTVRPGKVKKRDEEISNLREMIQRKRAELRRQAMAEKENVIKIGGVEIPADIPKQQPENQQKSEPQKIEQPQKIEEPQKISEPPKPEEKKPEPVQDKKEGEIKVQEDKKEGEKPKKSFQDFIDMSSSDESDDEANELIELAAIAKSIFDNPPDDDEAEEEGEEHHEEEKPAPGKFIFNGKELILDYVSGDDSLSYRVEALRQFIEQGLGLDTFLAIYKLLTDESDNMSDVDIDKKTKEILHTKDQLTFYPLLNQLIKCEDTLNQA
ncbi:STE family protein kinase [Trichomonas vaginalis G3]|uniref:non-specific serine/threonine protein kinase n=1 Tax=Trichomonas vaginalis (strain ATCC PRA-98 / G3) TaxID=412133 RepID=A2DIQ7_TRIV3|nr:CAMK family protein kinase family [Trichomonas vaginalis G3]EAY19670.1 STE family protein kinase [Trichomonas vaginalis G3]KAI5521310.1 CAMK family protein kinase family [Trichomonas vaginalis G3]|eukprot:XP_001580656.1 STE family protein kinase [Trichomonas vaginalis G3]